MNSLVIFLLLTGLAILIYNQYKFTNLFNQSYEDLKSKIILIQKSLLEQKETQNNENEKVDKYKDKRVDLDDEQLLELQNKDSKSLGLNDDDLNTDLNNQFQILAEDKNEIVENFGNRNKNELPNLESKKYSNDNNYNKKVIKSIYNQYQNYKFEDYFSDSNYNDKYYKYCPKKN